MKMTRKHPTRLARAMAEKGLSSCRLSKLLGIPQTSLSRWTRGICEPPASIAVRIALYLGTTCEELWKGKR